MNNKLNNWYSNGLNYSDVQKLHSEYAVILTPSYEICSEKALALKFTLRHAGGNTTDWKLDNKKDIYHLLSDTNAQKVSNLEGKVVEVFFYDRDIKGMTVNKNLIL